MVEDLFSIKSNGSSQKGENGAIDQSIWKG